MTSDLHIAATQLKRGAQPVRVVSPCCRADVTLHGQPAPRYHCGACGAEWSTLAALVKGGAL